MTLPADWAQIPVTGTYVDRTGAPMAGKKISFESSQVVVIDGIEIVPKTITCRLDDTGSIPDDFTLPSTDAPDLSVTGWAYAVREHWTGGRTFNIFVEYDGGTINLPTASPVATPPELQSALSAEVVAAAHGYALQAEASAQAAEDAAADVGDSANAAAASATDAQTAQAASEAAAAAAAASASSIGDSVTQAQAAQTAAETAASTATTQAGEASTSATAAGTAKDAAVVAKAAAETAKTAAEAAATAAGNSATAASGSATAAGTAQAAAETAKTAAEAAAANLAAWQEITQAAYDALDPPDDATLYVIVG